MISLASFSARSRQCGPSTRGDTVSKCKLNLRNEILIFSFFAIISHNKFAFPFRSIYTSQIHSKSSPLLSPEISHISAPKLNSRETWNQSCIFKELRDIDPENGYLIEIEFMFFASEMLFSFKRFPLPPFRPLHPVKVTFHLLSLNNAKLVQYFVFRLQTAIK